MPIFPLVGEVPDRAEGVCINLQKPLFCLTLYNPLYHFRDISPTRGEIIRSMPRQLLY